LAAENRRRQHTAKFYGRLVAERERHTGGQQRGGRATEEQQPATAGREARTGSKRQRGAGNKEGPPACLFISAAAAAAAAVVGLLLPWDEMLQNVTVGKNPTAGGTDPTVGPNVTKCPCGKKSRCSCRPAAPAGAAPSSPAPPPIAQHFATQALLPAPAHPHGQPPPAHLPLLPPLP